MGMRRCSRSYAPIGHRHAAQRLRLQSMPRNGRNIKTQWANVEHLT
ncbi:hypothetical protein CCACVL1_20807 [Corchorus capsularis]|uniref:Uncharacterized protein n=1 Tax=Corchorus capsularis TaxID=210143 RepID=A0A1R3H9U8_COCAP|nr:hypothetical protein CCACVL1_20807 [Corchorus capsularis]